MKSWQQADFKTVLTFQNWQKFDGDIDQKQTGYFFVDVFDHCFKLLSPKHIPKVLYGFRWPPGHPTMLMLSCECPINPQTPSVGSWKSWKSIKSIPKRLLNPSFTQLFLPKLIPQLLQVFKWPKSYFIMLMLSGVDHIIP